MQHSDQPYIELKKARTAIDAMGAAKSLDEFEESWKEFLGRIERVWNKAYSHFDKSPKWNGWKGKYEKARKNDPLLSYLVNARGADEHTVNEITDRDPGGFAINAADRNLPLRIGEMAIKGGNVFVKDAENMRIDFIPRRTKLLPIVNRGREYPVPHEHLGNPVDPSDVIALAGLAAAYYEAMLEKAEQFFVK
ncbi:hypothetical protein M3A49_34105 [Paraburkholderia sp. CNPSo 3076]|uniref:hypothetical protein n=1 Tax=Paraburkholderia sp. CNPSo 3076 TaxID=2940936 RepID=UPI0022523E28|nr:hypothetical protein [Paraburkholderia sp. CNPSo 3076]MCX5544440.1 hypothetical protein [Paraburkholderia sp. CNPSo 3076]